MKTKNRFLWFAGVSFTTLLLVFVVMLALFWQSLAPLQRQVLAALVKEHFSYIFSAGVLLLAGLGFILDWFFRFYIIPVSRLTEEVTLIYSVNPDFRTRIDGSRDIVRLGQLINEGADLFQGLKNAVVEKVQLAEAEAQAEKRILATIIAGQPAGILICNDQGQILLYNRRAKHYLGSKPGLAAGGSHSFLGLGRSIFSLIDKRLVVHALDEIAIKLEREAPDVAAYFIIVGQHNELLRTEVVPILDEDQLVTGLIMRLTDITEKVSEEDRQLRRRQELIHHLRERLATIRCSAELLDTYADIPPTRKSGLIALIAQQSTSLSDLVQQATDAGGTNPNSRWPVVPMMAVDFLATLKRKAADMLNLNVHLEKIECQAQVMVDSYALVLAMLFVLKHLQDLFDTIDLEAVLEEHGRLVYLDICYKGPPVGSATLRQWQDSPLTLMDESLPLTLRQVWNHHGAELWSSSRRERPSRACLRLCLPASEKQAEGPHALRMTLLPEGRPEFYDFDLFNQPGQNPLLDNRLLTELSYTVFDTETTGLNPKGGDEIISIGAVRVVNGRLLREEFFDQLVNPQRPLPYASVKIHGIQAEMLVDQPTIDKVLQIFQCFCEETILVAHNAAFDMRMLQLKEEETGVSFINPVLDTMHLSAVVHPAQEDHSISAIANRLGISVVGRHTALGDAITTGEIFLKLIPLLGDRGIYTLAEARSASQKTYYARLKY
jgi:DNA polymerase-3 subunit epsilon